MNQILAALLRAKGWEAEAMLLCAAMGHVISSSRRSRDNISVFCSWTSVICHG